MRSLKTNPRVEPTIREVGEEVEDDDEDGRHHEECHDRVRIARLKFVMK